MKTDGRKVPRATSLHSLQEAWLEARFKIPLEDELPTCGEGPVLFDLRPIERLIDGP